MVPNWPPSKAVVHANDSAQYLNNGSSRREFCDKCTLMKLDFVRNPIPLGAHNFQTADPKIMISSSYGRSCAHFLFCVSMLHRLHLFPWQRLRNLKSRKTFTSSKNVVNQASYTYMNQYQLVCTPKHALTLEVVHATLWRNQRTRGRSNAALEYTTLKCTASFCSENLYTNP